jgi:hypothetical protein
MAEQAEAVTGELRFTLLENALDSIRTALDFLGDDEKLKLVVMLLGQGVELVLKARLQQEHWSLVFDEPRRASLGRFESGDFKSVGFDECITRLKEICEINLEKRHREELKRLRDSRNRIEHFKVEIQVEAVEATAYRALSFLLDFVHEHFGSLSPSEKELQEKIRKQLVSLGEMVDHRWDDIRPRVDGAREEGKAILECPECSEEAAIVTGDDRVVCEFCHEEMRPSIMADALVCAAYSGLGAKERMEEDFGPWDCPECDHTTLVAESPGYLCLSCGTGWSSLPQCDSCGRPFGGGEDDIICGDCFSARLG